MDIHQRRALIAVAPNPAGRHDYVSTIEGTLDLRGPDSGRVRVTVRYVPDRDILGAAAFAAYLDALSEAGWNALEEAAAAILDDINNEVVPRWVMVNCDLDAAGRTVRQSVMLEDRQPNWHNPELLGRLERT